jgi:hypothetical protein
MTNPPDRLTDAPAAYRTARRPGQSGEDGEHRAGPNPRSAHPTGPHAPYEHSDSQGIAAEKHWSEPAVHSDPTEPKPRSSGTIKVIDKS